MTIIEQMARIGAAYQEARDARDEPSLARCLALFDEALADPRWRDGRDKELRLARAEVEDYLTGGGRYRHPPGALDRYFASFMRRLARRRWRSAARARCV